VNINPQDWKTIKPHYDALEQESLGPEGVPKWLERWSDLEAHLSEARASAYRAMTENTADADAERAYLHLVEEIGPKIQVAAQSLKTKLLGVEGFVPRPEHAGMLERLRAEAGIYRLENVPILTELTVLEASYDKIVGAMSVRLDGQELTLEAASQRLLEPDRTRRETAWRTIHERWLEDRTRLDRLFLKMLTLRRKLAQNAELRDYREYIWQSYARFDYTPEDCRTFHDAIRAAVVPLTTKLLETDRASLGYDTMRPWDADARFPLDPEGREPLKPFSNAQELIEGGTRIFTAVDPELGAQFTTMRAGFLDLESRPGKAPGGYCNYFPVTRMPYIFMNAVGTHDDVNTLLHEGGHAFHAFAFGTSQPLVWNHWSPMEFAEVGSMAMELLAHPYLERDRGGFYSPDDAHRARIQHLRSIVRFLPYMAIVDAFQHWLYASPADGGAPQNLSARDLDAKWDELWDGFSPGVDWTGFEEVKRTRWHRQGHIFGNPFYYVEYGMAQLGALQVWRNALRDQPSALRAYKRSLSLGYTRSVPELFAAADTRFAFDRETVGSLVALIETQLEPAGV
jgi:oligoendopeptidase F